VSPRLHKAAITLAAIVRSTAVKKVQIKRINFYKAEKDFQLSSLGK
jgi:hypothetical protein